MKNIRQYHFEFVNQKKSLMTFLVCFVSFFSIFFGMLYFKNIFNPYFIIANSFGLPCLYFFLNKKKIKTLGFATLCNDYVEISILGTIKRINFNEIIDYQIEEYKSSISLTFNLKNGIKYRITSSSIFCDIKNFNFFCKNLKIEIEDFIKLHGISLIRKKTFFENKWVFPFLIISSIIIGAVIVFEKYLKKDVSLSLFSAIGPLLIFWGAYFNAKSKKNKI